MFLILPLIKITSRALSRVGQLALAVVMVSGAALITTTVEAEVPVVHKATDIVATQSGKLQGKVLPSGVQAWFGVPYAQAPLRELRWKAPQPVNWQGVFHADRMAPQCIQPLRNSNINHYFSHEATSEDCLYMNIWAPEAAKAGDGLPVVVWIHGGGFTIGSPSMAIYGGEPLAEKGVITISIAYRLGILGFMAHPELTAQSPDGASGNYGLMDQLAALTWIKQNIRQFGGDPDNVTIAGQSAGSASVSYLQVSPLGKGLISKVVGMSGSAFMFPMTSRQDAEQTGVAIQSHFKAENINALRHISADQILKAQRDCQLGCSGSFKAGPVVDGYVLPAQPAALFADKAGSDIPVMIGFTRDEGFSPLGGVKSKAELTALVNQLYPGKADELLNRFAINTDAEAIRAGKDMARDSTLGLSMWRWSQAQTEHLTWPAFPYVFARAHPYTTGITFADHDPKTAGVYHTADVPYWLGTLDALNFYRETRTYTAFDRALSNAMQQAIVSFARTGTPALPDGNTWTPFTPDSPDVVMWGSGKSISQTMPWPNAEDMTFYADNPVLMTPPATAKEGARARD